MLLVNFLSQRLILLLGGGGFSFLQSMTKAVDFRNGIQNGIGILRGHGVEFPNPALAVHLFCRAQLRIQLVQNGVELFVRKSRIHLVGCVHPKRKGHHRTPIQLPKTLFHIGGIADFDVLRE